LLKPGTLCHIGVVLVQTKLYVRIEYFDHPRERQSQFFERILRLRKIRHCQIDAGVVLYELLCRGKCCDLRLNSVVDVLKSVCLNNMG
jgi:hypothetical protein